MHQRPHGPLVEHEPAARRGGVGEPQLAEARREPVGTKSVPTSLPAKASRAWSALVSSVVIPAEFAIEAASTLVTIPPLPMAEPVPPMRTWSSPRPPTTRDTLRATLVRRPVVERVDVGEEHEGVRVGDVRHEGGEPVVVAEADLLGRHGVVLVDDRDDAELEEPVQGALGVGVVRAPGHVVRGEEHLPHRQPVGPEGPLVCRDQGPLPPRSPQPAGSRGPTAASSVPAGRCRPRWHRRTRAPRSCPPGGARR